MRLKISRQLKVPWIGSKKIAKKSFLLILLLSFILISLKLQIALTQKIPVQDANQIFIVKKGASFDLNTNELSQTVSKSKEPVRALIRLLLQKGFLPTQIADSNAIALGGASFYRNRVNSYLKQGLRCCYFRIHHLDGSQLL